MTNDSGFNALEEGEPIPELPQPWLFMDTKCCCSKLDPCVRSIFSNETVGSVVAALILTFALLGVIFASGDNMAVVIGVFVSAAILGFFLHGISSFEHNTLKTSIGTLQTTVATKNDISTLATKTELKTDFGKLETKLGTILNKLEDIEKARGKD